MERNSQIRGRMVQEGRGDVEELLVSKTNWLDVLLFGSPSLGWA